jgi:hypothetical protein
MFKEIQIEDLRSSPTEEQAEIWAVPDLMTFLGEHAPTQSEAPWHCVFWHMPSLPMPVSCKLLLSYLSSAILLNTSPISPIDAGILRLYPTARWGSKRRSFGRSRVAIVGGWWHMVLSHFAAFNGGYRDLEYIQLIYNSWSHFMANWWW